MPANNYNQLLLWGIIIGSIIFFSSHISSYAQELTEETDEQQEDTGQEIQEELDEDDISTYTSKSDNIIEEGHDINQGNIDIPFELPFP
jgi:hypothetical protein